MANTFYMHSSGQPITLSRGASSTMRAEFDLIQTGFDSVSTTKGSIAGQTWTGTHTFPSTTYGVTAAFGATGTGYATIDFVNAVATNAALPGQTGNSGKFLTTNGTTSSWATPAFQTAAVAADVKTGTDTTKTVTSASMLGAIGFSAYMQTADQTITASGALTIAHGLVRTPIVVMGFLKNITAEAGYVAGDITPIQLGITDQTTARGCAVTMDSTNIYVRFGVAANTFGILNKTTGSNATITNANWSFFLRVLA